MSESELDKDIETQEHFKNLYATPWDFKLLGYLQEVKQLRQKLEAADEDVKMLTTRLTESSNHVHRLEAAIAERDHIIREAREQKPVAVVDIMFGGKPEIRFLPGNYDYRGVMYAAPVPAMPIQDDKLPKELTQAQIDVLGRPNFSCFNLAGFLIKKGIYKAPEKLRAESEQAIVIDFLNGFLKKYGADWRKEADKYLASLDTKLPEVKPSC